MPETAIYMHIDQFVECAVFGKGGMDPDNPLVDLGTTVEDIRWGDTGLYRETIISNVRKTEKGVAYSIRRVDCRDNRSEAGIEEWKSPSEARAEAIASADPD